MELKKNVSMLYIKKVNDKLEKRIIEVLADRALSIAVIKTILNLDDNRSEELIFEMEAAGQVKQRGGAFTAR